jgi:hypothetical protein
MAGKSHPAPAAAVAAVAAPPAPVAAAPATDTAQVPAQKYKISTDIPIPTKRVGVKGTSAYPFDIIGIGHSFFVPASDSIKEPWKTLTSLASRTSRELHPKAFTTARDTEDGQDGVRIWRTKDKEGPLQPPRPTNRKPRSAPEGTTVTGTGSEPAAAQAEAPPPPPPAA